MNSGGRIHIPGTYPLYPVEPETARDRLLALEFGVIIPEIGSEEALHDLFERQSLLMLEKWHEEKPAPLYLQSALRHIRKPQKNEKPFWDQPPAGLQADPTEARVLIPYVPQYGLMEKAELERDIPTHMTFGLSRVLRNSQNEIVEIRAARTNIWLMPDRVTAPDQLRAVKDSHAYKVFATPEECERFFDQRMRKRARSGFILKACLDLDHPG